MQESPKVDYLLCEKGGYHYGESLNMVCLDQNCLENLLCCCACIEQQHKDHNTKPLRLVLLQAGGSVKTIVPSKFNIDIALELINSNLKISIENFSKYKKQILVGLDEIQNSIVSFYSFLVQQVKLKNIDPKSEMEKSFQVIQSNAPQRKQYLHSIKRVAGMISAKKDEKTLSQSDILTSLNHATDQMKKGLVLNMEQLANKTKKYSKDLADTTTNLNIWRESSFMFSSTTKHPDIKIISPLVVKSANNSGYKFAIMEPGLQADQTVKDYGFKVKESSSSWVAVGMCHKNTVISKNYGFNFSAIGHGAYMISANGGSWSSIKAEQNNSIKAFKFSKGDIISIRVNFQDKTISFKRNIDKYMINFQPIAGDELCPCVLFYYMNDQIEFLPNHKF